MANTKDKMSDPTFRNYDRSQAKQYAESRLSYPSELYNIVLRHHAQTGGQFNTLLDVGCGPGNATRDLARSFNNAMGIDPSKELIENGRHLGGTTMTDQPIQFKVAAAEDYAGVEELENGVDLLVSAMAVGGQELRCQKKKNGLNCR